MPALGWSAGADSAYYPDDIVSVIGAGAGAGSTYAAFESSWHSDVDVRRASTHVRAVQATSCSRLAHTTDMAWACIAGVSLLRAAPDRTRAVAVRVTL